MCNEKIVCPRCNGTGKEPMTWWRFLEMVITFGTGNYDRDCTKCEGRQEIYEDD